MKLTDTQLKNFVNRIKLKQDEMPKYREQIKNLKEKLENKIKDDERTGLKVTKYLLSGSWKKRTILRPTGDHPIDIDLILYVEGDKDIMDDIKKLHDFVVGYLEEIYPQKDIKRDVDAEGNTKTIKIVFSGTGLEIDIVPVVPVSSPNEYVWQPQRGGGGKYLTSISKQLDFSSDRKENNASYTAIVRALKWWRNYKELNPLPNSPGLSSYTIELIVAYLDLTKGIEKNIEEGIIRFFNFMSMPTFPVINFTGAIKQLPTTFEGPVYVAESTNNENNSVKKMNKLKWDEITKESNIAFETLNIAQSRNYEGDTITEWKTVFGPSFNIQEGE